MSWCRDRPLLPATCRSGEREEEIKERYLLRRPWLQQCLVGLLQSVVEKASPRRGAAQLAAQMQSSRLPHSPERLLNRFPAEREYPHVKFDEHVNDPCSSWEEGEDEVGEATGLQKREAQGEEVRFGNQG